MYESNEVEAAKLARQQNAELLRRSIEEDKKRQERIAKRRDEWNATPDSEKICSVCGLKLDEVTKAKIAENPMVNWRHSFCTAFEFEPHIARGLVGLLKETYGDESVPLAALNQVVAAWRGQNGVCAISKLQLSFHVAGAVQVPAYDGSMLTPVEKMGLQMEYEREQKKRDRHAELHSPVLDYSEDGKLRLVSKTVSRMMEGLTPDEFRGIIQTLAEQMKTLPESRSFNPAAVSRMSQRSFR